MSISNAHPPSPNYRIRRRKNHLRLLADFALIGIVYVFSSLFFDRELKQLDVLIVGGLILAWYFSSKVGKLYQDYRMAAFIEELLPLFLTLFVQFVALSISLFLLNDHFYARSFTVVYTVSLTIVIGLKMYVIRQIMNRWHIKGTNQKNVVVVGDFASVHEFIDLVQQRPHYGYKIAGARVHDFVKNDKVVLKETLNFLKTTPINEVDELVIAIQKFSEIYVAGLIEWADKQGVLVKFTPGFFQFNASRYSFELFGQYPLVTVRSTLLDLNYWQGVKRAFDLVFSICFLLLIASWLFPILALAIKINSKGPVFFIQGRWGQKGKIIKVWKFRTMYHGASTIKKEGGFSQTISNDPRVTRVGQFLRKTNFDELPQFINVFLGSMSVVGPRPHATKHSEETLPLIDNYMIRHRVKPGITGWAQVNGYRGETHEIGLMRKRVEYDIWYIENWSLLLDIQVVFKTVYNMVKGDPQAY
ncbi:MAG TPA: hypothetical protein DCR35_07510 [Runella sp.]|nr:hypothetical protein [Runella sp.]